MVVFLCVVGVSGQINAASVHERSSSLVRPAKSPSQLRKVRAQSEDTLSTSSRRSKISDDELTQPNRPKGRGRLRKGHRPTVPTDHPDSDVSASNEREGAQTVGKLIKLTDGRTLVVNEAWKQGTVVWYTRGGVTQSLDHGVYSIESIPAPRSDSSARGSSSVRTADSRPTYLKTPSIVIHLFGGARFKVDEVNETSAGAWYSRGTLSVFLARERIERIDRIEAGSLTAGITNRDWTSGNAKVDELIKINGARFKVDPYLIFCVIEQESQFRSRAVSPKGAQGLMQLMPGTAKRLGVKRAFDPAENIKGGTQYLRELMDMFGGQVNLVLASYNAGEGAVMKYGRNVPPYRETQEYVRRIGKRYGLNGTTPTPENELPVPKR